MICCIACKRFSDKRVAKIDKCASTWSTVAFCRAVAFAPFGTLVRNLQTASLGALNVRFTAGIVLRLT